MMSIDDSGLLASLRCADRARHLSVERTRGVFEVWLRSPPGPRPTATIVGVGLTRDGALTDAHRNLLALMAELAALEPREVVAGI